MELDILLRGQSNAYLFVGNEYAGIGARTLVEEVQRLLGFDGNADWVRLNADWYTPGQQTIYGATAFIGDWVQRGAGGAWQQLADEQSLLSYVASHPQPQAAETAIVWLHSEYDSLNGALTAAEWESAVRADAAWVRQALGQDPAHSPYVFVSAIPFGGASDKATQAIRQGMEDLAGDAGFGAIVGARALDLDMSFQFPTENTPLDYGIAHMSQQDTVQTALRLARSLAEEWAQYARPNSPVALAGGNLAEDGPQVTGAVAQDANTLLVKVVQDHAAGFAALDPEAAAGTGWSVQGADRTAVADRAEIVSADTLRLHFSDALPSGGTLFYGYGYGRLAAFNQPGEGNAIYDQAGLPLWTPAQGIPLGSLPVAPPPAPAQLSLGAGSDTLVLRLSQDAWQGSAQYTVKVDGVQIGGTQTAVALHGAGQSDTVTVKGDWGIGGHSVAVAFLNDAYAGTPDTDRNLYVDGLSYDGATVANGTATLLSAVAANFTVQDSTALPAGAAPPPAATAQLSLGTGSDTLVLRLSQDAWQGSAQYTVKVDGVQIGGTQTAVALHGSGQSDTVTVKGDWGIGSHSVAVAFLNDAYAGTPDTDRNLYVDGLSYDGATVVNGTATLLSAVAANFTVQDNTAPAAPTTAAQVTLGAGSDTLVLRLSQDAWQGSAQYTVKVDGVQIGGTQTAMALHGAGQSDTVTVKGDWGIGGHSVAVAFLNDAYAGTPDTDRNLYVDGLSYDGAIVANGTATLLSAGAVGFTVQDGTAPPIAADQLLV